MKKIFIAIFLFALLFNSCDFIKSQRLFAKFGSVLNVKRDSIFVEPGLDLFVPSKFNETSRLFYLCKVWGFAKYYHQNNSKTDVINVDSILLQSISVLTKTSNKELFNEALLGIINSIQVSPITGKNPYPDIKDYCLIDNQWMKDTVCINDNIKRRLEELYQGHTGERNDFVFNRGNEGTVRQSNEKTYDRFDVEKIRLLGLFRYWNMINYFYPSKNCMDESWDKSLYESIPLFQKIGTKQEYHRAIYSLTNRLRDTHTSYPPSIDEVVFGPYRPNFRMMKISDTFVINEIRFPKNNTENFKLGDIVLSVGEKDVYKLYDSLQVYTCGGNYWSNQSFVCNAVLSCYDSTTVFTILRGTDTLVIHSKNRKAWDMTMQRLADAKINQKKALYKWVTDSVAYMDLTFANHKNFKKNFKLIKQAKAVILDLRCYPNTDIIEDLADFFVPANSFFAYVTYADVRFPGMLRKHLSSNDVGKKDYYKGKVFVLVNEWTESYSEYVTMLLQANPKVIVVGRSSSGADGNISTLEFPGGVKTIYSGIGIYYPGMKRTQRVGVKIDYIVEPTIESIQKCTDLAFEKAVFLSRQD